MRSILSRLALVAVAALIQTHFAMAFSNQPIAEIDLKRFDGKWYSLTSIPTMLDKDWLETIDYYTLRKNGTYDVRITYRKEGKEKQEEMDSRLFPGDKGNVGEMKAQFWWPFKVGYRVIDLAEDYSHVVVGHPDKAYLFIMSRSPTMPEDQMNAIITRCKELGYPTEKLKSQEHGG